MKTPTILDAIEIASPCQATWEGMRGDDLVRHCEGCRLNVYNLSGMTREVAEGLVRQREGRLCVRFYRRADGTVLTRDCPVGVRAIRRRLARVVASIAALVGCLTFGGLAARKGSAGQESSVFARGPLRAFKEWLDPVEFIALGMMASRRIEIIDEDDISELSAEAESPPCAER
ncbi:MAG TPA: hypothetical protein VGN42_17785 [Pirellulales bacterium]|jgi:hypothetical protein|nr:hypothetical protein [Pirellulales bacterium]